MEKNKKLGLGSVVSVSVGLVIATSCLVSLGQGAGTVGIPFIGAMIATFHYMMKFALSVGKKLIESVRI